MRTRWSMGLLVAALLMVIAAGGVGPGFDVASATLRIHAGQVDVAVVALALLAGMGWAVGRRRVLDRDGAEMNGGGGSLPRGRRSTNMAARVQKRRG